LELRSEFAYDAYSLNKIIVVLCVSKCIYHAFASGPYTALTISAISRGGVQINVSRYTIKVDFWTWPPVQKWFPRAWQK